MIEQWKNTVPVLYIITYSFNRWQNNKNHAFPPKRSTSKKKTCYCYTFYNENHTCIPVNKKILFVKKYFSLWVFTNSSILLFCFLNTNTAIIRQLIWIAGMLEADWWQVCGEAWVRGQRKMSQVLGVFGLLDFTMLRPILDWRAFWNLWTIYFFGISKFFLGCGQLWSTCILFRILCSLVYTHTHTHTCMCVCVCIYVCIYSPLPPKGLRKHTRESYKHLH